jgi:disulfide oxidoreductase YuzD
MESEITIGALIVVIIFLLLFIYLHNKQSSENQSKLLDRIMAHDYPTFVNSEVVREAAKRPDQIYEEQQEKGIPI